MISDSEPLVNYPFNRLCVSGVGWGSITIPVIIFSSMFTVLILYLIYNVRFFRQQKDLVCKIICQMHVPSAFGITAFSQFGDQSLHKYVCQILN